MSDRFSLQPNCSVCGTDLNRNEPMLMLPVGESIDLTCPKCGIVWRFWLEVKTNQKKVGEKKIKRRDEK
jgi:predicted RNA-binding Zn-ribbon protein involved in translation (DUF1610 family)